MSLVSRVVHKLPTLPASNQAVFARGGIPYDVAIGGLPFFLMASKDTPLARVTGDYKKDQVDTTNEPGEHSLQSWWLRSQLTFHSGAGIAYEEPLVVYGQSVDRLGQQFHSSAGVYVFDKGQVTLLKKTTREAVVSGQCLVHGVQSAGTDGYLMTDGAALYRVVGGVPTAVTWGGSGTILSIADDGTNYYVADATGIYTGAIASGSGSLLWNTGAPAVVGFVKQRLVAGIGNKLYELVDQTGHPTLPTARYTHPNTAWTWTAITEGPQAVYASGYAGSNSAVLKLTLDTSGNVPTLTSATVVDGIPAGERVYSLCAYLGKYLAIGTSKGVRIGEIDASGSLAFGSVLFATANAASPVLGLVGFGDHIYATATNIIDGSSGLYCIDLTTDVTNALDFAYATDLQAHVTGTVTSVALVGTSGRKVFGVNNSGPYVEHATDLEPNGYLRTGWLRFHTLEPKLFKYVKLRASTVTGSLGATAILPDETSTNVVTYTDLPASELEETSLVGAVGTPAERVALTFTFGRSASNPTLGPTFTGYQVKALPAGLRPRNIQLPLMVFDRESRSTVGLNAPAFPRLKALEALEDRGDEILYQDFVNDESRLVVIDRIQAVQMGSSQNRTSNAGFVVMVTLRTVA